MDNFISFGDKERLHYLEFGKGKSVVLVPSLWVTSKTYTALGRELGKYYHVFIPDIYCGKSEFKKIALTIEDYIASLSDFILKFKLKKYYLIGVSLSGIIVAKYLLKNKSLPEKAFPAGMDPRVNYLIPKNRKIKRLPVPVKLVFAMQDEYIPREAVGRLAKVKNLDLETIDDYHGWFFRREKELVKKIRKFFSSNRAIICYNPSMNLLVGIVQN